MELTAAEPRRRGLVQLYLDGEPGPKIDQEVFLLSRLKPGDWLEEEGLEELVERSDARRAREKALYLLEHRSHSKRELTEKIARTAASRQAAQAAADHLEELGLLDDQAYAESYAKELFLRKRYGARRVRQELARRALTGRSSTRCWLSMRTRTLGKPFPWCWSAGIPSGGRTRESAAGPWRPCSGWATPTSRSGPPWAGWRRSRGRIPHRQRPGERGL